MGDMQLANFKKIAATGDGSSLKDLLALKSGDVELVCVADNGFASLPESVFDVRVISLHALPMPDFSGSDALLK